MLLREHQLTAGGLQLSRFKKKITGPLGLTSQTFGPIREFLCAHLFFNLQLVFFVLVCRSAAHLCFGSGVSYRVVLRIAMERRRRSCFRRTLAH